MPQYSYDRYEEINPEEMDTWLLETSNGYLQSYLVFCYLFGPRPAEIEKGFTLNDVWLQEEDGSEYLYAKIPTKKNKKLKSRVLKLRTSNTPFIKIFLAHIKASLNWCNKHHIDPATRSVFRYKQKYYYNRMRELSPALSGYRFRHNRAYRMAQDGATEQQLRDWFGWVDTRPAGWYIRASGRLAQQYGERAHVI